jgi:hypothetical protein
MKVEQYPYLSDAAMALRRRDRTPPWSVHPCEVDATEPSPAEMRTMSSFVREWVRVAALRKAIEAEP